MSATVSSWYNYISEMCVRDCVTDCSFATKIIQLQISIQNLIIAPNNVFT